MTDDDPLVPFEAIAASAGRELPLNTDVAARVLDSLQARRPAHELFDREEALITAWAMATACAALLLLGQYQNDDVFLMLALPFFTVCP